MVLCVAVISPVIKSAKLTEIRVRIANKDTKKLGFCKLIYRIWDRVFVGSSSPVDKLKINALNVP